MIQLPSKTLGTVDTSQSTADQIEISQNKFQPLLKLELLKTKQISISFIEKQEILTNVSFVSSCSLHHYKNQ
jgi:hypothetical protein